ncbi:MAG: family 20 glycosylhydrolase [Pseudobacter sp.]|uniref:family 20 glycosylhydrolase n=1 Tax=Pseudobacter sp. TaxID=2045420 RepID=UPI003F7E71E3
MKIWVFLLLMHGYNLCKAQIPVLPLPVFYSTTAERLNYPSDLLFSSSSAGDSILGRLLLFWKEFSTEFAQPLQKPANCRLILLGKNAEEDALVAKYFKAQQTNPGKEGYCLLMQQDTRFIAALTEAGLFYGLQTLRQLTRSGFAQPVLIADQPAFAHRVVFDDISRGPIPTVSTIKEQIRRLAEIKINYLSFYIEHVIKTQAHPGIAPADGHLSIADIKELSTYAAKYHMQLIGSFQSFGHFEKILALPDYKDMQATPNLIDPDNPKAKQFLTDVIGEMCEAFSAPWFNVNCDETFDLGKGSSKKGVDSLGIATYYAKHISFLNSIVRKHNKQLMVWGDIAIQHEEILDQLPVDIVWLTWEYGIPASFDKWILPFKKRGLSFMVCPGVLNSNRLFPDHEMAVKNIAGFAKAGRDASALGVFTTVWDDGGAAVFAADWYGVYRAAEASWNTPVDNLTVFDKRYCQVAYNDSAACYTKALHTFLQLRKLPATWNMTDQFWNQVVLPEKERKLLLSNAGLDNAAAVLDQAESILPGYTGKWKNDYAALRLSISQYRLMINLRRGMPGFQDGITYISKQPANKRNSMLKQLAFGDWLFLMSEGLATGKLMFRNAWLAENQNYWLNNALKSFDEKITAIRYLQNQHDLLLSLTSRKAAIPDTLFSRLQVFETNQFFFQNWLLCGPFNSSGKPPSFLYFPAATGGYPKPGDQFDLDSKSFRWKKFASLNGGITYLNEMDASQWMYAYATIQSDSIRNLQAFLHGTAGIELYCNGQFLPLQPAAKELTMLPGSGFQTQVPLIKGINYLVIKLPGNLPDRAFAFRLHPSVTVVNHKHKYYLNPNTGDHEAE